MEDVADHIREPLQRALFWVAVMTVVMAVVLTVLIVYVAVSGADQRAEIKKVTTTTTKALCTLRHDFEVRVEQSRQFLKDHPNGFAGIPPQVIEQSIDQQQATIDALSDLNCGGSSS